MTTAAQSTGVYLSMAEEGPLVAQKSYYTDTESDSKMNGRDSH